MVLMVSLDLPGVGINRNGRAGVEIVARVQVARPGRRIAHTPVRQVALRVVSPGDPHRAAAGLPGIGVPSLAPGLIGARDRVGLPELLAGIGVERGNEGANAELTA